jgi:hypothetical protein
MRWTDRKARSLGYRNYEGYLTSEHWRRLRERYREAWPLATCLGCRSEWVQLHHISYDRFGAESLRDLIPLCGKCHAKVHEYLRANPMVKLGDIKASIIGALRRPGVDILRRLAGYYIITSDCPKYTEKPPPPKPEKGPGAGNGKWRLHPRKKAKAARIILGKPDDRLTPAERAIKQQLIDEGYRLEDAIG